MATGWQTSLIASLPRHPNNLGKLRTRHRLDRQPRQTEERHRFQFRIAFDLFKRDRLWQAFLRRKIHGAPIAFRRGRIRIGLPDHFRDTDYLLPDHAVVEKDRIAFVHRPEVVSRGVIAHACPGCLPIGDEIRPRIGRRFRFHEPELFHALNN